MERKNKTKQNNHGTKWGLMMLRVRRMRFAFFEGELLVYRFLFRLPIFFFFWIGANMRKPIGP